ncbi:MAG: YggS family pyridoxal phosphate-dependent enzyme [Eubacterium sp.]|nr:YggS family pyridoxal phosphate-dependent enzyme [Eubacterium sp.]
MSIKDNFEYIKEEIARAAERSGRNADDVLLLAVTKLHSPEEMNEVIEAGASDIGENKVQEVLAKYDSVRPVRWHLIGHLQTNKVRQIIDKVVMIQSVDSLHLAKEIEKRAAQAGITMDVLIQVDPAEQETKFGVDPSELDDLIGSIAGECPHVNVKGLMAIAPFVEDPEDARPFFREVKKIYDRCREKTDMSVLSMGMTNDFRVAVEEGSTMVRVGTAIFGARDYRSEEK